MLETIAQILPEWQEWLGDFLGGLGQFFAAGVLIVFIFWTIGIAVKTAFDWLREWT